MAGGQLNVLSTLDQAKTQWYHFMAIVIAGMGFFTDAYDLFCISLVTKLLGRIYYTDVSKDTPGALPPNVSAAVTGVALCGTLAGQLFFGWLGDKLGRKSVYGFTLILMVVCSVASGLSFGSSAKGVVSTLCFFRFWLGFGIGGDYPLSATIMSEYANKRTRGAFIAAVFAMQGFGILFGAIVALAVSAGFRHAYPAPSYSDNHAASLVPQADYVWRIILMFGTVPAALTYYWRMKMPETARYTALIARNAKQAAADMSKVLHTQIEESVGRAETVAVGGETWGLFSRQFLRRHGLHLLATTSTWFLLDIAFYSQNLFQKDIFSKVGWIPPAKTMNALEELYRIARAQALIALCGTIPGYWFTVAFIEIMGRFWIQIMGFAMMTAFMLGLAIPYHHWTTPGHHTGFIVMYGFTFFFANFGPNSTTFIVPAEIYPARLRSTCHGVSAAAGKAGAIIGAFGFLYAAQDQHKPEPGYPKGIGIKNALFVLAGTNFLGMVMTLLVPESKGMSLEVISQEVAGDDDEEAAYPKCTYNLFQKDIFSKVGWIPPAKTMNALEELYRIARAQALIALCGTIPGYWFTVAFIEIMGRFWIQIMGFAMMTAFMLGLAIPYHHWTTPGHHTGFIVMYGFTFFFANFGPNSTTFIVPAEIYPARLRSTCHGVSAAAGKAGAIIGAFGFLYAAQDQHKPEPGYPKGIGIKNALFVLAGTNFLGMVMTLLVPESKGMSLEVISQEVAGDDDEEAAYPNHTRIGIKFKYEDNAYT
uniref:H(+)/Pi cotransporter n=1 Tax=Oryza punctata TaxID=4537 RepID=A0A0E0K8V1_ORYPU